MNDLRVIEYRNIRVLTTQQLAEAYEANTDTVTRNFNRNKDRYVEGKHFICLKGDDLKSFRANGQIDLLPNLNTLYLWTEKGAFLHAKSLNTDKAWEVYDHLVDTYFEAKKSLSPMELMELQFQALKEVDGKVDAVDRDLQNFKQDMPILGIEESRITAAVRKKGVNCLGGKASEAYQDKSLRGKVYADIYGQLKREFGVDTYKAIKRSQSDTAVGIVEEYELPIVLAEQIEYMNSQMDFDSLLS